MAARPISGATLSFGLVSVPVKLYSSSETAANISFNWLHKKCGSRLKQQYVCPQDGEKVERDEMIKGYEFSKGQYVMFTPEELKSLEQKSTESIDIAEFVPADQVERVFMNRIYYLGPDKGGERAYRLLSAALQETKLSALARYAARGKQYLVLIRPQGDGLVMEQLHYADEVRAFSEVPIGEGDVKSEELQLAVQLVKQAATDTFNPEAYEDDVRKRTLEQIQRKVEGQEISTAPSEEPQAQIIDLMEALKASLTKDKADEVEQEREGSQSSPKRTERKKAAASSRRKKSRRKAS